MQTLIQPTESRRPIVSARRQFCPGCGEQAHPGDAFCVDCGARLRPPGHAPGEDDSVAAGTSELARAVRLISRGEPAEALRILTVLTAEQPDDAIARAYLGLSLLRLHRVADAREALELAVSMAPESFICRTKYAEFLARLGFFDQALAHLDIALNGEAPDAVAEMAARELRTFCKEKGKGIFYRPTASPTRLRLGNFLPRRRSANGSIQTTPGSAQ